MVAILIHWKRTRLIICRWVNTGNRWAERGAGVSNPVRLVITSAWNITGCADDKRPVAGIGFAGVCLGLVDR
ncbi:Uncharacterised protein [Enterobacter kobei]|nr:Uncharacterised protein [Enterobacter kobei]